MRTPIAIEKINAGTLYRYCEQRALRLDVCHRITLTRTGLVGLKGTVRIIVADVLADCQQADLDLGIGPEAAEQQSRNYLASLCQ